MRRALLYIALGLSACTLVTDPAFDLSEGSSSGGSAATTATTRVDSTGAGSTVTAQTGSADSFGSSTSETSASQDGPSDGSSSAGTTCGNGVLDENERCDGPILGESNCVSENFAGGTLACSADCSALDTTACFACGTGPDPVGGGCPPACDRCTPDHRCLVDCSGAEACYQDTLTCPDGFTCQITCSGDSACKQSTIRCSSEDRCEVSCAGDQACQDTEIRCGDGVCDVTCEGTHQDCQHLVMTCGSNSSTVSCTQTPEQGDGPAPVDDPIGSACLCDNMGCGVP
ncbi:MAG: hypothetical protein AAGF11_09300 [Myxococcota bacterium]